MNLQDLQVKNAPQALSIDDFPKVAKALHKEYNTGFEHCKELLQGYWVGVFEHYITDCPGYHGKVIFIVYYVGGAWFDVLCEDRERTGFYVVERQY